MTLIISLLVAGALAYVVCGVFTYGLALAYSQEHYYEIRKMSNRNDALALAVWPTGIISALVLGEWGYHGLQWRATEAGKYDQRDYSHPRKHL